MLNTSTENWQDTLTEEEILWQEIDENTHADIPAVQAYRDNIGHEYTKLEEWESWLPDFEEAYQGEMTTKEFAEQLADEAFIPADSPQWVFSYFDYEKFERDLFMGDYWESNGYIFRSN